MKNNLSVLSSRGAKRRSNLPLPNDLRSFRLLLLINRDRGVSISPIIFSVLFLSLQLSGQEKPVHPTGFLSVTSNHPVRVLMDSMELAVTPIVRKIVPAGTHILRAVALESRSWNAVVSIETLIIHESEETIRSIEGPGWIRITSEPAGATVLLDSIVLGQTPCLIASHPTGHLYLSRAGYKNADLFFMNGQEEFHSTLEPLSSNNNLRALALAHPNEGGHGTLYSVTAATVTTGVLAAVFKIRADNRYADYRRTGDERLLTDIHRLDTISGVSLLVSEIGLVTLTYLLFSRE